MGNWEAGRVFQAEEQHKQRLRGVRQPGVHWGEAGWEGGPQALCWRVKMGRAERQGHYHGGLHFVTYRLGTTGLNS